MINKNYDLQLLCEGCHIRKLHISVSLPLCYSYWLFVFISALFSMSSTNSDGGDVVLLTRIWTSASSYTLTSEQQVYSNLNTVFWRILMCSLLQLPNFLPRPVYRRHVEK